MTERILCGLPRSTSGDEDIQIGAVFLVRPMQMVLGAIGILGLPRVTKTIQIFYRWWVGVTSIELAHRIGADVRSARPRLALMSFRPHGNDEIVTAEFIKPLRCGRKRAGGNNSPAKI